MPGIVTIKEAIYEEVARIGRRPRLMEVCGTHTAAMFRHGLRSLLAGAVEVVSGPGCPVCVTPDAVIDTAIDLAASGRILAAFGDMLRVPGSRVSLAEARAAGADVRVVSSPLDTLGLAEANPSRQVVFFAVGFETTAPGTALLLDAAVKRGLDNLRILPAHKLIPPAMRSLLAEGGQRIDGFLCPGHVSAVIGLQPYAGISDEFGVPCVVAGFEPGDILAAILMLLRQLREGRAEVQNQYTRAVRPEGNPRARELLAETFAVADASWRGLGTIPASGLTPRDAFQDFVLGYLEPEAAPAAGRATCACGEILRGTMAPPQCPAFARSCTPASPLGPCMVSSEGACGIHFAADRKEGASDA